MSADLTIRDHLEAALEKHLEAREEAAAAARERVRLQCENSQLRAELLSVKEELAAAREAQRLAECRLSTLRLVNQPPR